MNTYKHSNIHYNNAGFSLIELMVAVLIGITMLAALISLFTNFSSMNRAQNGLARIQENGRYVFLRMKKDLENVGFQPCSTISMDSPVRIDRGFAMRPYISFAILDNGLPATGVIDTQYLIQGHECDDTGICTPALGIFPGGDPYNKIPNSGITANSRAHKTDVLTVRYLTSNPVNVDDTVFPSTHSSFTINQDPKSPPLSLESGDNILIANCINTLIVRARPGGGNNISVPSGGFIAGASVQWASRETLTSVYNFTKSFSTVSYYVGFKQHPDDANRVISSLYRIENGDDPQELIEGVERFDLRYGVQFSDGRVAYLRADEIQNSALSDCTIEPLVPESSGLPALINGPGCLWRSVFAVKVNFLLNTVYNSATSDSEKFIYSPDGLTEQLPADIPSGINPGYMYRKEFSEIISLQSNNL
ncbi:MAG: PilW family protein [Alcanivoracaceae bacterium]|nr:PilW family protein [Alcanivoracaceae bacterium]